MYLATASGVIVINSSWIKLYSASYYWPFMCPMRAKRTGLYRSLRGLFYHVCILVFDCDGFYVFASLNENDVSV